MAGGHTSDPADPSFYFSVLLYLIICRQSRLLREMEAHIATLRASSQERRALEERVWQHHSHGSRRRTCRRRLRLDGQEDFSVCSNASGSTCTYEGVGGQETDQASAQLRLMERRDGAAHGGMEERSPSAKAAEATDRKLAQKLHAEEVMRRKRYGAYRALQQHLSRHFQR